MHKSKQAALDQILTPRYLKTGLPHSVYPCPKAPGVWHIRTGRAKKNDPKYAERKEQP
jgi:hypothetical protein